MENAKISIIVPAYNLESYLPKCLDSILAQTYQNIEVIVIDDGSTDGTGKVLDDYVIKDRRVKGIHQDNTGVMKARFNALRQATGDWISFVDGDDYIDADMFERLLKNAVVHEAEISHCGYERIFPNSVEYHYNTGKLRLQDTEVGIYELIEGSKIEPGLCNKLFKKELFEELLSSDLENSGVTMNEDLLMNYYLFRQAKKSVYEDFCPYHYVIHTGSATTAKKPCHYLDEIRVMKTLYEETKEYEDLNRITYSRYIYRLICASIQTRYKEISNESQTELKQNLKAGAQIQSIKLKMMAIMAVYFRPLYRGVRRLYDAVQNLNHKRNVY